MKTSLKNTPHPLAVGDFTKYQDLLKEHGLFGVLKGDEPTIETVETKDVRPIEAQRDTDVSWAYTKIKQRHGLDLSVMTPIKLVRVDGKLYCYDGLGRLLIHQLMGINQIKAFVQDGTFEQASGNFSWENKKGIRSVAPESVFSADIGAKDPDALLEEKNLKKSGLAVRTNKSTGKTIPKNSGDPLIKIRGFRQAMEYASNDVEIVKMARDIVSDAYTKADGNCVGIRDDLLVGLTIVLDTYESLRRPGAPFNQLQKFFDSVAIDEEQVKLPFKKEGGNQHNLEYASVAYGIVRKFTRGKHSTQETCKNIRHKTLLAKFENLTEIKD